MISKLYYVLTICLSVSLASISNLAAQDDLNLSMLNGYNHGFYVNGAAGSDEIAKSLATGDINGDGIDDLIVGAPDAFSAGPTAGNTYVIYGTSNKLQEPISVNQLDGSNGFVVYGDVMNDNMGKTVASGDFNGDGKDDLIIGAPLADPIATQTGEVYLLLSDQLDGSSNYSINGNNSSLYLTIFGSSSTALDNLGESIAAGDVNSDGYDDILIGAPNADTDTYDFAGKAYLVYGSDLESLGSLDVNLVTDPPKATTFSGSGETNFLGSSVHIANLFGGFSEEIIIGARSAGTYGKVYVVAGLASDSFSEDEYDIESSAVFTFSGDSTGSVGRSKSISSGDINGNGQQDLILTSFFDGVSNAGKAYVILDPSSGFLSPSDLNGTNGFIIKGGIDGERLGTSVTTGDLNNDGIDDIILGASAADPDGISSAGKTYVFFGRSDGFFTEYDITEMASDAGFVLTGNTSGEVTGSAVASGDFNGDGYSDVATGAPLGSFSRGRAYVFTNTNYQEITGNEGFRMLSTPASGNVLPEIYNPLATQGFPGADFPGVSETNMWVWNVANQQWETINSLSSPQQAGDGILFYTFADDDFDGNADLFPKLLQSPASFFEVSNYIPNRGAFNIVNNLADDDYDLIGNPYGSTINWNANSGWTKTNLSETIYIWSDSASNNNGAWLSWNGTTGSLGSGEISSFQSFFVKAQGGDGSLIVNENVIQGSKTLLKSNSANENIEIILELSNEEHSNQLYLSFQDDAEVGTDMFDGHYLVSLSDSYLSFAGENLDGDLLTINALPPNFENSIEIPLFLESVNTNNVVNLKAEQFNNINEDWTINLIDHQNGESFELLENDEFVITIPENYSDETPRYSIEIISGIQVSNDLSNSVPKTISLQQNYPNPFNPTTQINYSVPAAGDVQLSVYDMLGRKVSTLVNENKAPGRYSVTFDASNLSSGMYIYRLNVGSTVITKQMTLIK